MNTDKDRTIAYYRLMIGNLKEGGYSANRVAAYERQLRLYEESADDNAFSARLEELNLTADTARAAKLDEYAATIRALEDSDEPDIAARYRTAAEQLASCDSHDSLAAAVQRHEAAIKAARNAKDELLSQLTAAALAYLALRCTHGGDRDRARCLKDIRSALSAIGAAATSPAELLADPWFSAHLPFDDARRREFLRVVGAAVSMQDLDGEALAAVKREMDEALCELAVKRDELAALHREEDARARRREFLAVAPADEPGPYDFLLIHDRPS